LRRDTLRAVLTITIRVRCSMSMFDVRCRAARGGRPSALIPIRCDVRCSMFVALVLGA
jgi:hypothetical protein